MGNYTYEHTQMDEMMASTFVLLLTFLHSPPPSFCNASNWTRTFPLSILSLPVNLLLCNNKVMITYVVMTAMQIFDPYQYSSACYSATVGTDSEIQLWQLCATPEKPEYNGVAFNTFTCRNTFAGEQWGVLTNKAGNGITPGGQHNNNNNYKKWWVHFTPSQSGQ